MNTVTVQLTNCKDCKHHAVIPDPDPHDWFCDDDVAVICTLVKNPNPDRSSLYHSDSQEYSCVTTSCRPYNTRKECNIPNWCPLLGGSKC